MFRFNQCWSRYWTVFGSLILATARNPQLRGQLFTYTILGFTLAEATGLFALMMALPLYYYYILNKGVQCD